MCKTLNQLENVVADYRMDGQNIKMRKVIEKQKYKKNREIFRKIFGI